jgi:hypothetical protein
MDKLLINLGDGRVRTQSMLVHSRYRLYPAYRNRAGDHRSHQQRCRQRHDYTQRVEVTFSTVIAIQARRSAMKVSV